MQGNFDFKIAYPPEDPADNDDRTPMWSAVREQVGLKLETQPGPVEVPVVLACRSRRQTEPAALR
jgi:uncharacterized protein (TIGR03435 family)